MVIEVTNITMKIEVMIDAEGVEEAMGAIKVTEEVETTHHPVAETSRTHIVRESATITIIAAEADVQVLLVDTDRKTLTTMILTHLEDIEKPN